MKNSHKFIIGIVAIVLCCVWMFWARGTPAQISKSPAKLVNQTSVVANVRTLTTIPASSVLPSTTPQTQSNSTLGTNASDFASIFQAMLDAGRIEHDPGKQLMIQLTLIRSMRERTPSSGFFAQLKEFIADKSNSNSEREMVISLLGNAGTKESLDLLIYEATTLQDKEPRDIAIGAIGGVGALWGDGKHHEELSPALDSIWQASNDQNLLIATSFSMAKIGTPSSIELLLSAALAPSGMDDVRKRAAQSALEEVYTKNAVPPLAAALANQSPTSPQAALAFATLTQISDPTAAQVLIAWLQSTDSSAVPLIQTWASGLNAQSEQSKVVVAALDPMVPFSSEANREALRAGLATYQSNHHFISTPPVSP